MEVLEDTKGNSFKIRQHGVFSCLFLLLYLKDACTYQSINIQQFQSCLEHKSSVNMILRQLAGSFEITCVIWVTVYQMDMNFCYLFI